MRLPSSKVEVKVLLEILAVYFVLAIILVSAYYLGSAMITGFATVTKQFNYGDEINLEFNESGEFVWTLANPGNLKSIKIDGSVIGSGKARVYIEHNNQRYLIFDNSRLVEKSSGIFGITGFVAKENKDGGNKGDEDKDNGDNTNDGKDKGGGNNNSKDDGKIKNKVPVWNSDAESFYLNGSLSINLSMYFYDADNDLLTYSSSNVSNVSAAIYNELITLIPDKGIDDSRQITLAAYDGTDITFKRASLIVNTTEKISAINETLANETAVNNTAEKTININFEYGDNGAYDANNDGIESRSGIIDFTVKGSTFNWDIDGEKLCTRYEIYSAENEESTFTCFGSNDCCNLINIQNSRELWNESLLLGYGGYGSAADNIVFAQLIYADYNLSTDEPYSDVAYSSWGNLTAKFSEGLIEFEDVCIDSCLFDGNASSYKIIVELEDSKLNIDKIRYAIEKETTNREPVLAKQIGNVSILKDDEYTFDLSQYFSDPDNDSLEYGYYSVDNITIRFEGNSAYITPDKGFTGSRFTYITANDSYYQAASNVFKIEVNAAETASIELLETVEKEGNLTVRLKTSGSGNLTINPVNGTYAELYNDNSSTINDLDILELKCGNFEIFDKNNLIETDNLRFILMNNSKVSLSDIVQDSLPIVGIYVEDYKCNEEGHYTVRVLKEGKNAQAFNFSNQIKIASSGFEEEMAGQFFEIRNKEDDKLAVFDSFGNADIKGNLTQNASLESDANDFIVQNSNGSTILVIKNPEGIMQIKGVLNENQSALAPEPNSFIIQNKKGEAVAYVGNNGSLFLRGILRSEVLP